MSTVIAPVRKLAAILFADIVGYTKWVHEDEANALDRRRQVEQLIKGAAVTQSGRVVKFMGDGAMLEFPSAVNAVSCALQIQSEILALNTGVAGERKLQMRIGIHVGDVVEEGSDLYGTGVNIASRVQTMAAPGGICITREVYTQIKPILKLNCDKVSSLPEKDLPEPVDVFAVGEGLARPMNEQRFRNQIGLFVFSTVGWGAFFLVWNQGLLIHALVAYTFFALLSIVAPRFAPIEASRPLRTREKLYYRGGAVLLGLINFIFLLGVYTQALDYVWQMHVDYRAPGRLHADAKALTDQFPRLLPSIANAGTFDVRAPSVNHGILFKNLTSMFYTRSWNIWPVFAAFTVFYLAVMIRLFFVGSHDKVAKKQFREALALILVPLPIAFFLTSFPSDLHHVPNPVPLTEYHIKLPSKIALHILHQWGKDLDGSVGETAVFPVHAVSTGKKLAELHIMEFAEADAYSRWKRTAEGITMMRPPFQIRFIGNASESHVQLDFGKQPGGKIPAAYLEAITALEKWLKSYAEAIAP
jgi:class 3 adenylate cyclase